MDAIEELVCLHFIKCPQSNHRMSFFTRVDYLVARPCILLFYSILSSLNPFVHPSIPVKESIQWERFCELASSKVTRGHRYKLFKKWKEALGQKFFSARVVDLWNELDDSTVTAGIVTAFKRMLVNLGY